MKNINLKFDFKQFVPMVMARFSMVLWIFLGLVILSEVWVIKGSVDKIFSANDPGQFGGAQLTRVNFSAYDEIDKRLSANATFLPEEPENPDPFGLPATAD